MTRTTPDMVLEFHEAFGLPAPGAPTCNPAPEVRKLLMQFAQDFDEIARQASDLAAKHGQDAYLLRVQLHASETAELWEAMAKADPRDLAPVLAELADVRYVSDGTAVLLGLDPWLESATGAIHAANMTKLEDGRPVKDAAGRVRKGRYFQKADIRSILKR